MEQNRYAVIVAGGSGLRMGGPIPKQFMLLSGEPVLMRTIRVFAQSCSVVLVLPASHIEYWQSLCAEYKFNIQHTIVEGGSERFFSVKNGLSEVPEGVLVAIHDGVRPLVSQKVIDDAFILASKTDSAIPVVPSVDSLRVVDENGNRAVVRSAYRLVQTPQVFNSTLLKQAYNRPYSADFTDDASVFESMGNKIYLSDGDRKNIKLTTAEDIAIAETFLKM